LKTDAADIFVLFNLNGYAPRAHSSNSAISCTDPNSVLKPQQRLNPASGGASTRRDPFDNSRTADLIRRSLDFNSLFGGFISLFGRLGNLPGASA
jgi:hypothetical protein